MQEHPSQSDGGQVPGISHDLIQEIARAAVNYALTKELRYHERLSYRRLPRIALEGFASEEHITFDATVDDYALIEAIVDKKVPLEYLRERCQQLGIDISNF